MSRKRPLPEEKVTKPKSLPIRRVLVGIAMHEEVDKGANLWLREFARWVNRVDTLGFLRQFRHRIDNQTLFHRISVKEAWKVGDAQP